MITISRARKANPRAAIGIALSDKISRIPFSPFVMVAFSTKPKDSL